MSQEKILERRVSEIRLGIGTYKDNLEEHFLIDLHELLIPLVDIGGLLTVLGVLVVGLGGIVSMVLAPFEDLPKHGLGDVGNGNGSRRNHILAEIRDQILDQARSACDSAICIVQMLAGGGHGCLSTEGR